jgi:60 kDa SS-A/Ro ribonucleoprotein
MVQNAAGGYAFAKDLFERLQDFLILGTEGNTYYADEKSRTLQNVQVVHDAIRADGLRAVKLAVEISTARPARAVKNFPALYTIAAALCSDDLATRQAAAGSTHLVARTTDHQAHLFGYVKSMKGKPGGRNGRSPSVGGPVFKRAWTNLFVQDRADAVAYRYLKARSRKTGDGEPFSPRDLLRIAKPVPNSEVQSTLFGLISGKVSPMEASGALASCKSFYEAQLADTPAKAVRAINAYHVPWEFLPTEVLKHPEVWEALVPHLGMTALIRNLSRMTQIGTLGPFKRANRRVAQRLTDQAELHAARIHPFDLLLALKVYESGAAQPNLKAPVRTWDPVPEIVTALNEAYVKSFAVCDKIPGNLLVAVDSSGSMQGTNVQHGGSNLGSAYRMALAFGQILMRTWGGQVHMVDFDQELRRSPLRADMTLSEINRLHNGRGWGTDASVVMRWATQHRHFVDGFVLITDNESWAGDRHASQALTEYRRTVNPNARVIWAATVPNGYSLGDPTDPGMLNVQGFDSNLATLVSSFIGPAVRAPMG